MTMMMLTKIPQRNRLAYLKYREAVRKIVMSRLEYFNKVYAFPYKRVAIRSQKTRWGSCSQKGNLNFNYRLVFLPHELQDYLIVHELCHVKEFNHGKNFWLEVARTIPDFKIRRRQLKAVV